MAVKTCFFFLIYGNDFFSQQHIFILSDCIRPEINVYLRVLVRLV